MTVPTTSWDETAPAGSAAVSQGDDRIRELKTQVREVIAVDHEMASSGQTATTGYHEDLHLKVQSTPAAVANTGNLYTKDVNSKAELHFQDEDSNEIQLTSAGFIPNSSIYGSVCCRAYLLTQQDNIASGVATKVLLIHENFDVGSDFDQTNSRFVAPVTGYYQVNAKIGYLNAVTETSYHVAIFAGTIGATAVVAYGQAYLAGSATSVGANVSDIIYVTAGQVIELYALHYAGVDTVDIDAGSVDTFMSIHLVGNYTP